MKKTLPNILLILKSIFNDFNVRYLVCVVYVFATLFSGDNFNQITSNPRNMFDELLPFVFFGYLKAFFVVQALYLVSTYAIDFIFLNKFERELISSFKKAYNGNDIIVERNADESETTVSFLSNHLKRVIKIEKDQLTVLLFKDPINNQKNIEDISDQVINKSNLSKILLNFIKIKGISISQAKMLKRVSTSPKLKKGSNKSKAAYE